MADLDKDILIVPNTGETSDPTITFSSGATGGDPITLSVVDDGTTSALSLDASSGNLLYLENGGKVGIGTITPNAQLQLTGDIWTGAGTAASPAIKVGDNNTGFYYPGGNQLGISANGSEVVRINAGGQVGIGTTTPFADLSILADASGTAKVTFGGDTNSSRQQRFHAYYEDVNQTFNIASFSSPSTVADIMTLNTSGNVGIGTSNPLNRLQVEGGNILHYSNAVTASLTTGRNANENIVLATTDGAGSLTYNQDETDATDHSFNFIINSSGTYSHRFTFNKPLTVQGEYESDIPEDAWAFRGSTTTTSNDSGLWFSGTTARLLLRDSSGNIKTMLAANGDNTQNVINGNKIWHEGNDGDGSGLDADKLRGVEGNKFLRNDTSGTLTGTLTTTAAVSAYNGNIELLSDGIYFEAEKHAITWNDGGGNFNIRVGNTFSTSELCTEIGYAFQDEWLQSTGVRQFNVSSASLGVGDAISWRTQLEYDSSSVYLRYQGSTRLTTTSGGISVTGDVTASTFNGALNGNASTATKWANTRTITLTGDVTADTVNIDGSGNIIITNTVVTNDSHTHDTRYYTETEADSRFINATGDTMAGQLLVQGVGANNVVSADEVRLSGYGIVGNRGTVYVTNNGPVQIGIGGTHNSDPAMTFSTTNTSHKTLYEGSNRVFNDGYHPNADKWTTARTITLGGSLTGNVSIDGSANVTLTATVGDNTHNHSISTITDEHRLFNNMGDAHNTQTSFVAAGADMPNFGWRYVQGATGGPGTNSATQYYSVYVGLGDQYIRTQYGMQIAYPRNVTEPYISIRYNENGSIGSWQKISAGNSDKLGGQAGSYYLNYNNFTNTPTIPTVSNAAITIQGTSGLTGSGVITLNQSGAETVTISHADTSSQDSVNNSNGNVIQDVSLDGFGHVTSLVSTDLDNRYLQLTGGTVNGETTINSTLYADKYIQTPDGVPRGNLGAPSLSEIGVFDEQFTNKTAFYPLANFFIETSTNGTTWTTFSVDDTNKKKLVGGDAYSALAIPRNTAYFRIRFKATGYVFLNALYSYWAAQGNSSQVQIYKKAFGSSTWEQHTNSTLSLGSWPGHLYLPFSTIGFHPGAQYDEVAVVFIPTWNASQTTDIKIYSIQLWGGYPAQTRNVFSTDEDKNVTFPAAVGGTVFTGTMETSDVSKYLINFNTATDWGLYWDTAVNQMQFRGAGNSRFSIDLDDGSIVTAANATINGTLISSNTGTRDKLRVWDSSAYSIGMKNGYTYGHLNDYAMSFQMDATADRGFWWGRNNHSDAQGAMSLHTDGKLTVATSISVGEGQSITSPSSETLYVSGNATFTADARVDGVVRTSTISTSTGQQLVLNAGEAAGKFSGQTAEYIYLNAESGLLVSTPDRNHANFEAGYTQDTTIIRGDTITINGNRVLTVADEGSENGLDADLLDGLHATSFIQRTGVNNDVIDIRVDDADFIIRDSTDSVSNYFWRDHSANILYLGTANAVPTLRASLNMNANNILNYNLITNNAAQTRDKLRVWSTSSYTIGMKSGFTYGHLNDYAMSFQMNNDDDRGFWWGDDVHTDAQGAMSLTTEGRLTVATSISVGQGQSITSPSTETLYVSGNATFTSGGDTQVLISSPAASTATLNIRGTSGQGSGVLYVGQDSSYGGGIEYNGDNSPATSGAGADYIALYRRDNNVLSWTARNYVTNNDWEFRGNVTASSFISTNDITVSGLRVASGGATSIEPQEGKYYKYFLVGTGVKDDLWKKVCDVTIASGLYAALEMKITLYSADSNYGNTATGPTSVYSAAYHRSTSAQDVPNNAVIYGEDTPNHGIRIIKTATGSYELQILQKENYRDAIVDINVQSTNGGTVTMTPGVVNGSTTGTAYTPTVNTAIKLLMPQGEIATVASIPTNNNQLTNGAGYVVEGGTTFTGTYPVVVRTSAGVVYSNSNITFNGTNNTLSVGGPVIGSDLRTSRYVYDSDATSNYLDFQVGTNTGRFVAGGAEAFRWGANYLMAIDSNTIRLGTGSDFRMWHDGNHTYFRNYNSAAGNMYWQGYNTGGTNQALAYLRCDAARTYVQLFENGAERLRTTSTGATVYGTLNAIDGVQVNGTSVVTGNVTGTLFAKVITADTINANMIQANSVVAEIITAEKITAGSLVAGSVTVGGSTSALKLYDDCLKIFESGNLRVKLGNLSNTTDE